MACNLFLESKGHIKLFKQLIQRLGNCTQIVKGFWLAFQATEGLCVKGNLKQNLMEVRRQFLPLTI